MRLSRVFSVCTVLFAAMLVQAPPGRAELVTTDGVAADTPVQNDREKVRAFLDRATVQEKLKALGVKDTFIERRVDSLTDQEVRLLAQRIDSLPAGGALSQTDIIIILLIAILVAIVV